MSKINKFYNKLYPLTLSLGLIFLNFDIFEKFIILRFLGRGLIVLSILLFFMKYSPRKNERKQNGLFVKYGWLNNWSSTKEGVSLPIS